MPKLSKRFKAIKEKLVPGKIYSVKEAVEFFQSIPPVKFIQSLDVAINLGVDPRKSDQVVRSATVLPNGTGKELRVAVITQGDNAEAATAAGADLVGFEDLAETIKGGEMSFDVLIATPDAMRIVGQLGPVLGPRGLMPNPKVGTVTTDVANAVKNAKAGQVRYRTDKAGIIHCCVGTMAFTAEQIQQNLSALMSDLKKAKPSSAKGIYFQKVTLSSTMGPGLVIDLASIDI